MDETVRVVLLGRAGCHLCDQARAVVARVCADLGVFWREHDLNELDDLADVKGLGDLGGLPGPDSAAELRRRHADDIPVTFVDGEVHDFWRVDEARLREALAG